MKSVLVVGYGSIGKRHVRNLQALGVANVMVCRHARGDEADGQGLSFFYDLAEAVAQRPDGVIVANPTALHLPVALPAVEAGIPVLIEKPVSHTLEGVAELEREAERRHVAVQVAYCLRFHPVVRALRVNLERVGRPLSVRCQVGQYLPDWRPGQDVRSGYSARAELGGGVLLDLSHELDYLQWLFGTPDEVSAMTSRAGGLTQDSEEAADVTMRAGELLLHTHLDYWQRSPSRTCEVIGTEGTLVADLIGGTLRLRMTKEERDFSPPAFDRNGMYLDELRAFFCTGKPGSEDAATLGEGRQALETVVLAKRSAETGRRMKREELG